MTSSISLDSIFDLTDLRAHIYAGNTHDVTYEIPSIISNWENTVNYSSTVSVNTIVLNPISLAAGSYALQIKGTVSCLAGGSYGGVLNIAQPVSEPETYGMLLAGLSLVGFTSRRKNNKT